MGDGDGGSGGEEMCVYMCVCASDVLVIAEMR